MDQTKPWYTSKTIWGALIAGIAAVLNIAGVPFTDADQTQLVDSILSVVTIGGSLFAMYGRVTATKEVTVTPGASE